MARMPQTTPRRMIKALKRLGFVVDGIEGSHHYLSRGAYRTCVALHARDLPRKLIIKILKDAGVTPDEIRRYL